MYRLNRDDIEPRFEATLQDAGDRASRVRRLGAWLRRRLGRACSTGLWTLTRDGKLACESWQAGAEQCD